MWIKTESKWIKTAPNPSCIKKLCKTSRHILFGFQDLSSRLRGDRFASRNDGVNRRAHLRVNDRVIIYLPKREISRWIVLLHVTRSVKVSLEKGFEEKLCYTNGTNETKSTQTLPGLRNSVEHSQVRAISWKFFAAIKLPLKSCMWANP